VADDEGAGGTGAASAAGGAGTGGAGGEAPTCEPPQGLELVASGLVNAREIEVFDGWVFALGVRTLWRIPVCGGPLRTLAENPRGAGSLQGLSVGSYGVRWGAAGNGAVIGQTSLHGEGTTFDPVAGLLAVAADAGGPFSLSQAGELVAHRTSGEELLHQVGSIGYWSPLVEDDGWLYFGHGSSSPNGPMTRVRSDGSLIETLLGGHVPGDVAVRDGQVYVAIAHGIDQIQTFDATALELVILASAQPSPSHLAVGADDVYFVADDGVRVVRRGGGEVAVAAPLGDVQDVALDAEAFYFVTADGRLFRAPLRTP